MPKRFFIPINLFIKVDSFDSALPPVQWPDNVVADMASPTGYYVVENRKTYVDEKPAGMAETKQIKHPIENGDYIEQNGNNIIVHKKADFETMYKELITP